MTRYREEHFGNCPVCGRTNGCLNIGRNYWFVCHEHKTKWYAGSSVFSGWQFEPESDWLTNAVLLNRYRDVEPVPPRTLRERQQLLSEKIRNLKTPGTQPPIPMAAADKEMQESLEVKRAV